MSDGGSAFPYGIPGEFFHKGLLLRDYFAGQATVGYITAHPNTHLDDLDVAAYVADLSYGIADALIARREVSEPIEKEIEEHEISNR